MPDSLGDAIDQRFKQTFDGERRPPRHVDPTATDADELGDAESRKTLATE